VPYSEFEKVLGEGRIAEVSVTDRTLIGRLKTAEGKKTTLLFTRVEPDLAAWLAPPQCWPVDKPQAAAEPDAAGGPAVVRRRDCESSRRRF